MSARYEGAVHFNNDKTMHIKSFQNKSGSLCKQDERKESARCSIFKLKIEHLALSFNKFKDLTTVEQDSYFPNGQMYCKQPDFFNFVYSDKNGNGNKASGDGYKFRGRGILQVTGRVNYKTVSAEYNKINPNNKKNFETTPELLETDLECAVLSACIWWKKRPINSYTTGTTKEDVYIVSKRVNGRAKQVIPFMPNHRTEANHLKERWESFEKICKQLGLIK